MWHAQSAVPERRVVEVGSGGSSLDLSLCRAHPTITYLKPPLPGAVLKDVVFLEDGRLALQVALPDGEQQAWTLDPDSHLRGRTASLAAVCTLSVAGDFCYLAWALDGRVLYGALLRRAPASGSISPFGQNPAGVFVADPREAPGRLFSTTAAFAPARPGRPGRCTRRRDDQRAGARPDRLRRAPGPGSHPHAGDHQLRLGRWPGP